MRCVNLQKQVLSERDVSFLNLTTRDVYSFLFFTYKFLGALLLWESSSTAIFHLSFRISISTHKN